tara:strand:+ start:8065 stop:8325 length:261 start_codon:yes stop_codon:yes gene_type:complete
MKRKIQNSILEKRPYNESVDDYYLTALLDLFSGVSFSELRASILFYEEIENYEACAGIKKALDEVKYYTINELKIKINEIKTNDKF